MRRLIFILTAMVLLSGRSANSNPTLPDTLTPFFENRVSLPWTPATRGLAISTGQSGDILILLSNPIRLLILNALERTVNEIIPPDEISDHPNCSIAPDGSFGWLMVIPGQTKIYRFNRRGEALPPIHLQSDGRIEPLAVSHLADGGYCVLNRFDSAIWRVNRDGQVTPTRWLQLEVNPRLEQVKMVTGENGKTILLVMDFRLWQINPLLSRSRVISQVTGVNNSIAVDSDFVWLYDEKGVTKIEYTSGREVGFVDSRKLKDLGVLPASDFTIQNGKMFFLTQSGNAVVIIRLEADLSGDRR